MYRADVEKCGPHETCLALCPVEAISTVNDHAFIDMGKCIEGGSCIVECGAQTTH